MAWQYYRVNGMRRLARTPAHAAEVHAAARARFGLPLNGRACLTVYNSNGGVSRWRVTPGWSPGGWKAEPWQTS